MRHIAEKSTLEVTIKKNKYWLSPQKTKILLWRVEVNADNINSELKKKQES